MGRRRREKGNKGGGPSGLLPSNSLICMLPVVLDLAHGYWRLSHSSVGGLHRLTHVVSGHLVGWDSVMRVRKHQPVRLQGGVS